MTGVVATPPSGPSEVTVIVEPESSSLFVVPVLYAMVVPAKGEVAVR